MLYTSGQKHLHPPRVWKGQVVRVLNGKSGGAADGARNSVLLHREEGKIGRVVLKLWASRTLSGCLDAKVWEMTEQLGTSALIRDHVCWQGEQDKKEPWTIALEVMYPTGFVRRRILFKDKFYLWDCPADIWQHMNKKQLGRMWRDMVASTLSRILQVGL